MATRWSSSGGRTRSRKARVRIDRAALTCRPFFLVSWVPEARTHIRPDSIPLTLPEAGLGALFGVHDENLRLLEDAFGVEIAARGREVSVSGDPESTALAARLLSDFSKLIERGYKPKKADLDAAIRILKEEPSTSLVDFFENRSVGPALRQVVSPRNVERGRRGRVAGRKHLPNRFHWPRLNQFRDGGT